MTSYRAEVWIEKSFTCEGDVLLNSTDQKAIFQNSLKRKCSLLKKDDDKY